MPSHLGFMTRSSRHIVTRQLAELGLKGNGTTSDKSVLQALINSFATAGIPLVLPKATYAIDISAGGLTIPANAEICGSGSTFLFMNPPATLTRGVQLQANVAHNVKIRDLTLSWPAGEEGGTSANAILYSTGCNNITLENVTLLGWGESQLQWNTICNPLQIWKCNGLRMRRVTSKWSVDGYGLELLGVTDAVIEDSDFVYNGADGVKIHGDGTYGSSSRIMFRNVRMNYNGQMDIQGYSTDIGTAIASSFPTLTHGARYQIRSTTSASVTFPAANTLSSGQAVVISRHSSATSDKLLVPPSGSVFANAAGLTTFFYPTSPLPTNITSSLSVSNNLWYIVFSGTSSSVALPDASTLTNGQSFYMYVSSPGATKTFTPNGGDTIVDNTGNSLVSGGNLLLTQSQNGFGLKLTSNGSSTWTVTGAPWIIQSALRSQTLKFESNGVGKWTVTDIDNGGGVDMTASRVSFEGCEAIGNESAGFQLKPTEASATSVPHDISYDRCLAADNWSNGFGVYNSEVTEQAASVVPHSVVYTACTSTSNLGAGFHLNGYLNGGQSATYIGCTARKNNGGFVLDDTFRYTHLIGCFAYENGGTTGTNFNVLIDRCNFWTLRDCVISGIDPVSQVLGTLTGVDGGTPAAYGVFIQTGATAMKRGVIDHCQIEKHTSGRDVSVYPNPAAFDLTVSGSPGDISIGANGQGVLYFGPDTPQATLTTPTSSYGVLTFA